MDVVRYQRELGIDVPGDGEFGKSMAQRVNYGSWWRYSWQRLAGIETGEQTLYEMAPQRSLPGHIVLTSFGDRRDRTRFAAAYNDPESGITTGPRPPAPVCVGPLSYAGHEMIRADIANFKSALAASGAEEGFMTAVAPSIASNTGARSPGEELMTPSTSAVAVCCSSPARVSLISRAFSIAMTACLAKLSTRSICLSVNGSTRSR